MNASLIIFLCFSFCLPSYAQLNITGVIKDAGGNTLPGASVFISGYKKGAVANSEGLYVIKDMSPGKYDLIVQMIGYEPHNQSVNLDQRSIDLVILLKESNKLLDEVVIKPDRFRMERLKLFKENFLGSSANAKSCKILNLDDIDFSYDDETHVLSASSRDFLIIENSSLGYRIKYLLKNFTINDEKTLVTYYGYPVFEELRENKEVRKRYAQARQSAYLGSPQHFFRTLFNSTAEQEGFIINKLSLAVTNPDKASDSVIAAKLNFFKKVQNKISAKAQKDSLRYWTEMADEPNFLDILHREQIPLDSLVKPVGNNLKSISCGEALYISYVLEKESKDYIRQGVYQINRPKEFTDYQISVLNKRTELITFNSSGILSNPESVLFEGYWSYEKVGDLVPLDYIP